MQMKTLEEESQRKIFAESIGHLLENTNKVTHNPDFHTEHKRFDFMSHFRKILNKFKSKKNTQLSNDKNSPDFYNLEIASPGQKLIRNEVIQYNLYSIPKPDSGFKLFRQESKSSKSIEKPIENVSNQRKSKFLSNPLNLNDNTLLNNRVDNSTDVKNPKNLYENINNSRTNPKTVKDKKLKIKNNISNSR